MAYLKLNRQTATHLGGDDFDQRVIDWLLDEFKSDEGIDYVKIQWLQRLRGCRES